MEDKADLRVAQFAALVGRQALDVLAVERELAAGERLQQAGDVEEGGLARARRPGDGDELALLHVQVERTQRVRFDQFGAVDQPRRAGWNKFWRTAEIGRAHV